MTWCKNAMLKSDWIDGCMEGWMDRCVQVVSIRIGAYMVAGCVILWLEFLSWPCTNCASVCCACLRFGP